MIHIENRDGVVVLRMERGKVNAMDVELCDEAADALESVLKSSARALVLTGTGNTFSAGVDLLRVLDGGRDYVERFLPAMTRALRTLFAFPKPAIAAVNGHAIAGGFILACACDLRMMSDGPWRVGIPELSVGVPFPAIAFEVLRFAVPRPNLTQLIYSGRTVPAADALRFGLIDEVHAPNRLLDSAIEAAARLGAVSEEAFTITKRELRAPYLRRFHSVNQTLDAEVLQAWSAPEALERIRAYLARTIKRT